MNKRNVLIRIRCPKCGVPFLVSQDEIGKTTHCFFCSEKKKVGKNGPDFQTVPQDDVVPNANDIDNWGSLGQFDFRDS